MNKDNFLKELSNDELVAQFGNAYDPTMIEMLKAEQRQREIDKALNQSNKSNKIAIASLLVATSSLFVAIYGIYFG